MAEIVVDVWLYGVLARYGGPADRGSYANPKVSLSEGSTLSDLLASWERSGRVPQEQIAAARQFLAEHS